jgi:hypothetical protein
MKLVRAVRKLEQVRSSAAPASSVAAGAAVGLVWTTDEATIERDLKPGEFLACDLYMSDDAHGELNVCRYVERVTLDRRDKGVVYSADGARVGRVRRVDGSLVSLELNANAGGGHGGPA